MSLHKTISIHALREEGDVSATSGEQTRSISIHALREEGDASLPEGLLRRSISIHALREEGDIAVQHILERDANFYPRPPRGGRHRLRSALLLRFSDFYPRPPRGGRRCGRGSASKWRNYFYPRPPRGGRRTAMKNVLVDMLFLSTPSARRATPVCGDQKLGQDISIHALREEGDWPKTTAGSLSSNFYPRPPRGGRPTSVGCVTFWFRFLSTPSARRATPVGLHDEAVGQFLSTPSARRATSVNDLSNAVGQFLSTPSARRATNQCCGLPGLQLFLSTPSARRATSRRWG